MCIRDRVNTWPVGQLAEVINSVSSDEILALMNTYQDQYDFATDDLEAVRYQAREEIAIKKMMDAESCMAFTNTFQDLYGMRQLPGLASQHLMAQGYGYGGEGDWKTCLLYTSDHGFRRQLSFRSGTWNGIKCLFLLDRCCRHGLQLADCPDRCICGRSDLYPAVTDQCAGSYL